MKTEAEIQAAAQMTSIVLIATKKEDSLKTLNDTDDRVLSAILRPDEFTDRFESDSNSGKRTDV